jgi:hypothetical protein
MTVINPNWRPGPASAKPVWSIPQLVDEKHPGYIEPYLVDYINNAYLKESVGWGARLNEVRIYVRLLNAYDVAVATLEMAEWEGAATPEMYENVTTAERQPKGVTNVAALESEAIPDARARAAGWNWKEGCPFRC